MSRPAVTELLGGVGLVDGVRHLAAGHAGLGRVARLPVLEELEHRVLGLLDLGIGGLRRGRRGHADLDDRLLDDHGGRDHDRLGHHHRGGRGLGLHDDGLLRLDRRLGQLAEQRVVDRQLLQLLGLVDLGLEDGERAVALGAELGLLGRLQTLLLVGLELGALELELVGHEPGLEDRDALLAAAELGLDGRRPLELEAEALELELLLGLLDGHDGGRLAGLGAVEVGLEGRRAGVGGELVREGLGGELQRLVGEAERVLVLPDLDLLLLQDRDADPELGELGGRGGLEGEEDVDVGVHGTLQRDDDSCRRWSGLARCLPVTAHDAESWALAGC